MESAFLPLAGRVNEDHFNTLVFGPLFKPTQPAALNTRDVFEPRAKSAAPIGPGQPYRMKDLKF